MPNNEKHHSTHHSEPTKVRMLTKARLASIHGVSIRTFGRKEMTDSVLKTMGLTRDEYNKIKVFTTSQTSFLKFYFKIEDFELED